MRRRSLFAVDCTVIVGMAATQPLAMHLRGPIHRDQPHGTLRDKIVAVAEALELHWAGDGPQDCPQCKLILSELPIRRERQVRLHINQPGFEAWRGTVAVYVGQAGMVHLNADPDHPERATVWCDSFVYGDPVLIERLRSCVP
jgi:hypothetical protein